MLRVILFLQIVLLGLFTGSGYLIYQELLLISNEVDNALVVIADIQALLPKLESAIDTVNNLDEVFENLTGISEILNLLLNPLQGNS
ncbi:hypothetical protein OAJ33_03735 [Acidimicrobiaceae bacterium]|nr:hypothetical protein [Acidimicrobiaceae bacterium]